MGPLKFRGCLDIPYTTSHQSWKLRAQLQGLSEGKWVSQDHTFTDRAAESTPSFDSFTWKKIYYILWEPPAINPKDDSEEYYLSMVHDKDVLKTNFDVQDVQMATKHSTRSWDQWRTSPFIPHHDFEMHYVILISSVVWCLSLQWMAGWKLSFSSSLLLCRLFVFLK